MFSLRPKLNDGRLFEHIFIVEVHERAGFKPKERSGELKKAAPVSPSSFGSRVKPTLPVSVYKVKPRLGPDLGGAKQVRISTVVIEHLIPFMHNCAGQSDAQQEPKRERHGNKRDRRSSSRMNVRPA
jgi:hypothetical protein